MLLMQLETVSVAELAAASEKAMSMPAQPDTETIDEQHDRISATMAAGVQKKYLREHYGSIASDHAIAVTLSQVTPVSSKKPKTCRVLGLDVKCQACKERTAANRCTRRKT